MNILLKNVCLGGEVEMLRGVDLLRKTNLGLKGRRKIKMLLVPLRLTIRGVLVPKLINLLAQIV